MSNDEFSSVEWLVEQIKKDINLRLRGFDIDKALEQAEAMRKDEIKNAQMDMFIHLNNLPYGLEYLEKRQSAEDFSQQYYNETFGGNNEQAMIDYNKMEEEWEMENYNEMKDEQQ